MAEWDAYWIVSQILNLLVFAVFFVTLFMIPSKEKVRSGQEGKNLLTPTIPLLLGIIYSSALIIAVVAFLLVDAFVVILVTDGVLILASVLLTVDYISTRKLYTEVSAPGIHGQVHHNAHPMHPGSPVSGQALPHNPQQQLAHGHPQQTVPGAPVQQHLPAAEAAAMMTVECPNCSGHIEIPDGSDQITCPYCGLSGTL